ncbi:hypothetical protein SAMN02745857_03595 [Andreprevotia lacus DSM 23236]|jgi:hypothetical protein|uniref:Uncharacterized protein n=1 Tax=Andreprevotia lacus DSM 23236 TaxID=1121001 RepID=A0A1W1XYU9_9NEIS|nr:hypothetical protein [Andreprevotia lacus]SMC29093.1 hypothetical protein SAMN02745857_03595 [Andreprevotia lacus DSM 23236]
MAARTWGWIATGVIAFFPANWLRLLLINQLPYGASKSGFVINILIGFSVVALLVKWLLWLGRRERERLQHRAAALQAEMAQPLQPINAGRLMRQDGEEVYAVLPAQLMSLRTTGHRTSSSTSSHRHDHIFSDDEVHRTTTSSTTAIQNWVPVANGELALTNERVVFAGDADSFAIALDKLLNITPYANSFGFNDQHNNYMVNTGGGNDHARFHIALCKLLRERMPGLPGPDLNTLGVLDH